MFIYILYICLRSRDRASLSIDSFLKCLQWPGLGWIEAGNQELNQASHVGGGIQPCEPLHAAFQDLHSQEAVRQETGIECRHCDV